MHPEMADSVEHLCKYHELVTEFDKWTKVDIMSYPIAPAAQAAAAAAAVPTAQAAAAVPTTSRRVTRSQHRDTKRASHQPATQGEPKRVRR